MDVSQPRTGWMCRASGGKRRNYFPLCGLPLRRCRASSGTVAVKARVGLASHCIQVQRDFQELDELPADIFRVVQHIVVGNAQGFYVRLTVEPGIDLA